MDGVETTVTLRKMGYTEPIVALTANALAGQSDKFIQKGFDEFISKPIDTRQLNQILNKLIRDKQPQEVLDEARKKMNGEAIQAKTSSLIVDAMRSVKGIGVDAALAVLGGMLEVYENTIKLSARLMPITINKMDSCLTEENLKNFAIEVHGFKGVAKSIGAAEIAETANRLEIAALNNEKDFCKAHYPDFKTAVVELMTKMNEAINQEPVDKKEKINPEELTDKLTSAKQFAEEYDAMAALELLKPLLNYTFNEEAEALLEKAVFDLEEFNCVNAVEKLSGIIQLLV
jgi:HPt (histidine-containing phosphotransfer) domain-containing protein